MDSKLPATGTTIFAVMTALATECDAINLSQGFPSFSPPQELLDRVTWYLNNGANQYAPMTGMPALRQAIADKVERLYGRPIDANTEVTVADGATEGLFSTIHAVVHPGDEVIVFDPAYDSYEPAITLAGGKTTHLPLLPPEGDKDFRIDWAQLEAAVGSRTRLVILNFPHNPTGAILSAADLDRLADIVRDTSVYLLSDEVYEHIVFGREQHQSLARHAELWQRSFVVSSFGKTYHATGWKIGYCIAPAALTHEFRKIHQWTCYAVNTPMQCAIADFMRDVPRHTADLPVFYEQKRDRFCELVQDSRFEFVPAKGTFFQLLDYSNITDEDDVSYSRRLTKEIGVASIPISVFCATPPASRLLRFCFAKDDRMLEEAAARLCRL
jgi:methionine aminotransferase